MKQASNARRAHIDHSLGSNVVLLGKRHEYEDLSQPTLGQIAQKIGFTSEEIAELERLYGRRFKDIK